MWCHTISQYATMEQLISMTHLVFHTFVLYNGLNIKFRSFLLEQLMNNNGNKHHFVSSHHPASHGESEVSVCMVKEAF